MDELRPEGYENDPVLDDEAVVPPDADVLDRLAAYGEPHTSVAPVSDTPEASVEQSVEVAAAHVPDAVYPYGDPEPTPEAAPAESVATAAAEPTEELAIIVEDPPVSTRRFGRRRGGGRTRQRNEKRPKKLVGLEIGSSQIAAAHVLNNGAPELVELFHEPLDPGLVVSGEIRDPEVLGNALKRFFELHKLPKSGVRLGVANNRIGVRIFEIEGTLDPVQLENAIRFRAEEVLPIPLDEAVLDYVVLDEQAREDGTERKRILLVVAYREVVERYLQASRHAGLQVVGIDHEGFALLRSLEPPADRDESSGALVAVGMGHDRTIIAVSNGRKCEFTRVLDWGGWSLNVAIARALDRAPSEVEGIKRQLSFSRVTEIEGLTPERVEKTREAIGRALGTFARELVSSLQFYQAQPGALGIGEIVLTGGTAHMDGLSEAVGEQIGVPVRLGDPLKRMRVGPNVSRSDGQFGSFAVAIGLGIED